MRRRPNQSTGNYWITAYDLLEAAGIEVFLVNARHVKGVPGHKTDVQDAAWLQQLHAAGLLRKSYRPAAEILPLRYLMRHRQSLVAAASQQVQAMQKVLTELNLKIQHVFSDVDGVSAQAIITAILAGERDPDKLAALRDRRCRSSTATIKEALRGSYREEYLFVLRQSQQTWQRLQEDIAECDTGLARISARVEAEAPGPLPPPETRRKLGKNGPQMQIFEEAWRYYGVDLSAVPGVSAGLLSVLMSELGTGGQITTAFSSAPAFCSWLGLCPDNRVSGGRVLKAKTRKVANRVAGALRMGVFGLHQSDTKLGEYTRRMSRARRDRLRRRSSPQGDRRESTPGWAKPKGSQPQPTNSPASSTGSSPRGRPTMKQKPSAPRRNRSPNNRPASKNKPPHLASNSFLLRDLQKSYSGGGVTNTLISGSADVADSA